MAIEKKPSHIDVECRLCGWLCACSRGTLHTTVAESGEVTTGNCDECAAKHGLDDLCPGHSHDCECGDYRVGTKPCVAEDHCYDGWICPDCEVTEKLEALQRAEEKRKRAEEKRLMLQMLSSHPTVDLMKEVVAELFQPTIKGEKS